MRSARCTQLAQLTPDRSLFAAHPEYFPLIDGKRKDCYSEAWGGETSFCPSNEEAMKIVVASALRYVEQHPFIDLFALYPPDGSQRSVQCQCEACAKMNTSDRYLLLMNRIAAALEEKKLATPKLMWISYNECGVIPRTVEPRANGKNMVLLWCNDLRVHDQPFDSEANRHAAPYLERKPRLKTIKTDAMRNPGTWTWRRGIAGRVGRGT